MGGSFLNPIGYPLVIPKPFICVKLKYMNRAEELLCPLSPHGFDQSHRKEGGKQALVPLVIDKRQSELKPGTKVIQLYDIFINYNKTIRLVFKSKCSF